MDASEVGACSNIGSCAISETRRAYYSIPHHSIHSVRSSHEPNHSAFLHIVNGEASFLSPCQLQRGCVSARFVHLAVEVLITVVIEHAGNFACGLMRGPSVPSTGQPDITIKVICTALSLASCSAYAVVTELPNTLVMISASSASSEVSLKVSLDHAECTCLFLERLGSRNSS